MGKVYTPEQLRENIKHDEVFWYYRLLDRIADQFVRQKGQ